MLASVFMGAVGVGVWALQDEGVVDMRVLGWMQAGAGAVGVVSKVPQIWVNWQQGGTGVLSAFTVCFPPLFRLEDWMLGVMVREERG